MNNAFTRFVSRVLIASLIWLPLQAQAELIAAGEAGSAAQAQSARTAIAARLESFGLARDATRERIAALTDAEVLSLAGRIDSLPAGADGVGIGVLLVILFLIWRFSFSDQAKAETSKSAPKPAPEQKK